MAGRVKSIDFSPREVFLGMCVPGKRMVAMLEPHMGSKRLKQGESLVNLYRDTPQRALIYVSLSLDVLSRNGIRFRGPLREFTKRNRGSSTSLHFPILIDIRDFLKFRFRTSGLSDSTCRAVLESLSSGRLPVGVDFKHPEHAIQYAISVLDILAKETKFGSVREMASQIGGLGRLLKATAESLMPAWEKKSWYNILYV